MLRKPRILSLFLNSFNKKNEHSCKIPYLTLTIVNKTSKYDQAMPQSHTAVQPTHREEETQNPTL